MTLIQNCLHIMDIGHSSSFLTWHLLDFMHHHSLYCPSPVSITFVLCNDLDRAAPKSLAYFTAAANFYLLMTAPMTNVFVFHIFLQELLCQEKWQRVSSMCKFLLCLAHSSTAVELCILWIQCQILCANHPFNILHLSCDLTKFLHIKILDQWCSTVLFLSLIHISEPTRPY